MKIIQVGMKQAPFSDRFFRQKCMICCKYNMFGVVNCDLVNINYFHKGSVHLKVEHLYQPGLYTTILYHYTILLNISCNSTVSSKQPNNENHNYFRLSIRKGIYSIFKPGVNVYLDVQEHYRNQAIVLHNKQCLKLILAPHAHAFSLVGIIKNVTGLFYNYPHITFK